MRGIWQRDTKPELIVRRILHALGFRYRVQDNSLPGTPDIANRKQKWVVFVHGCFWHHHTGCRLASIPKRNRNEWIAKFAQNRARDASKVQSLLDLGYTVLTVWQCELSDLRTLEKRLIDELPKKKGARWTAHD